jgi:polyisoprenyl-phosphate glycosyltransferase
MLLSIAVPVYNEKEVLGEFLATVRRVMKDASCEYEIVFVDDGSTDGSTAILERVATADPRIKVVFFSRNFGHQIAITAALDHAVGDIVVIMDADLQDPPEFLITMIEQVHRGYDVVSAQRISRDGETVFKKWTAEAFYWLMNKGIGQPLVPDVGDFRMFSRRAVLALRQLPEQHRFVRGMVSWIGLKEIVIPYHRQARAAGTTKYPLIKMLNFAWTAISSFSALPLRLSTYFGLIITFGGIIVALFSMYASFVLKTVPGWTSLIVLDVVFSGAILTAIGLVGEYLARVYEESKGRPLYIVSNSFNLDHDIRPANGIVLPPATLLRTGYQKGIRKVAYAGKSSERAGV